MALILCAFGHFGRYILFLCGMVRRVENVGFQLREVANQAYHLGVKSFPIVVLVSVFAGAVTAIQMAYQLSALHIPFILRIVGRSTRDTVLLEIACTFNGIVLAGVIGSKIASELGNMRISNQIDALEIMGIDTKAYLILPKLLGFCLMTPFLGMIAFFIGIAGGKFGVILSGMLTADQVDEGLFSAFKGYYVLVGTIKIFTFSFIVSSVSAYFGYTVKGGAVEIGKAATNAVVTSCILILLFDYLLTILLF